jgi:hypothetical protein
VTAAPSFLREAAPARARRGEWIALAALAALLAAQLFLVERARLAADPRWRPLVQAVCGVAGCSVPPWREPGAFAMLARDVIAVPGRPGVLRVQASLRNDARWPQPWPVLRLSLSDAGGRVLGARRFRPAEYLGRAPAAPLLAPGQAAQLAFDIAEPGPGAVAFDFRFE